MKDKTQLTEQQLRVVEFIQEYHQEYAYGPRQSDIAEELEVSQQRIAQCVRELRKDGWIESRRMHERSRGSWLSREALQALGGKQVEPDTRPNRPHNYPSLRSLALVPPGMELVGIGSFKVDSNYNKRIFALGVDELGGIVGLVLNEEGHLVHSDCGTFACSTLPDRTAHDVLQAGVDRRIKEGWEPPGSVCLYGNEANRPTPGQTK